MNTAAHHPTRPPRSDLSPSDPSPHWLELVADEVKSLRFGIVQITVHDKRVVQVERTERTRFDVRA